MFGHVKAPNNIKSNYTSKARGNPMKQNDARVEGASYADVVKSPPKTGAQEQVPPTNIMI